MNKHVVKQNTHRYANLLLLTMLAILMVACGGSGSAKGSAGASGQGGAYSPNEVDIPNTVAQRQYYSLINLKNPNAELNTGAHGATITNAESFGWDSQGPCFYMNDYIAAGNGGWRMNLANGCELFQMSSHQVDVNQAFSLIFSASSFAGVATSVVVELYLDDADNTVVERKEFDFLSPEFNNWRSYQVLLPYGKLDDHVGQLIGVRFINPSNDVQYLSIDNVIFEAHEIDDKAVVEFSDSWDDSCDQLWVGESFWANRTQDWHVTGGRLETQQVQMSKLRRTVHRISTVVSSSPTDFSLQVQTGSVNSQSSKNAYSGFLIGAGFRLDHRAAALIHNRHGKNGGIIAGVNHDGHAFILDNDVSNSFLGIAQSSTVEDTTNLHLNLSATYLTSNDYELTLIASDNAGMELNRVTATVPAWRVMGSIGLVASPGNQPETLHWFNHFEGAGEKLISADDREFGPIMFGAYSLSRQTLTVNAQLPPVCASQYQNARLEGMHNGVWSQIAAADIHADAHTAQLRVNDWDDNATAPVRIAVDEIKSGAVKTHHYYMQVQADPVSRNDLVVAGLTCRPGVILSSEGWIQQNSYQPFSWTEKRITFPHQELLINAEKHNADLIAFTGDQIYEFDPNGWVDKNNVDNLINDYLYKWYLFGWSVRDFIRTRPSIIIPDDHDVFQSNVWGEGGRAAATEHAGGFVYPARFIEVVNKTQTGGLPPPFDPTPVEQDISVYYTDIVYGGVGVAVLEDRKFKSGPHSPDRPQKLLGERQHTFLRHWAADWEGQEMKLVVSQAPFAMSHTHSGGSLKLSGLDQDSNGWPKPQRDEAVSLIRSALAPHLNGDQHLGLTLKHGVDKPNDAFYSFSVPSMLNIFPRIWDPQNTQDGPGDRTGVLTGSYIDQHGNYIDVLAAANPNSYYNPVDVDKAQSKYDIGTGYGIVNINKPDRMYTMTAWPINADPENTNAKPYPGWPISFYQQDNDGREVKGYLPEISVDATNPVVQVYEETSGSLVYAKRLLTTTFTAPVYDLESSYTVNMLWPELDKKEVFTGLKATAVQ